MFNLLNNPESAFEAYKSLFEYNPDATYAISSDHKFILYNQAAVDLLGYSKEEVFNSSFEHLVSPHILEFTKEKVNLALQGYNQTFHTQLVKKNGVEIAVSILLVPIQVEGVIKGVIGVTKDNTELITMETLTYGQNRILEKIAKNNAFKDVLDDIVFLFEKVFKGSRCAIMLFDKREMALKVGSAPNIDPKYLHLLERLDVLSGQSPCRKAVLTKQAVICEDVENNPEWSDYKGITSEQNLKTSWAIPFYDESGEVLGTFDVYFNQKTIFDSKRKGLMEEASYLTGIAVQHYITKKKISALAYRDPLTGLSNRRSFEQKVEAALEEAKTSNYRFSLLFVDLDRFKIINDTYGHDVGDQFLIEVSKRLNRCLRDGDVIARLGGDEFTALLKPSTCEITEEVGKRIIHTLEEPLNINGIEIFATPSIGISFFPDDGDSASDLIKMADTAMYQAKNDGGNSYRFHDNALINRNDSRLCIENHLRKALENNEFSLHYQPKLNLKTQQIMGVEALLRWDNPYLGSLSPDKFIPIAEESGLIIPIGRWVLEAACQQLCSWSDMGINDLPISVNLSFRQFRKPGLIKSIDQLLKRYGVSPELLELEITESMTMDIEIATNLLCEMKELGVRISMDDFGTGYSSFNHLKHFPLDYIKVDKSFVNDIGYNNQSEYIVKSIFMMSKAIGFKVIAEGVETMDQYAILNKLDCDGIQGYFFSKPLPIHEFNSFYKGHQEMPELQFLFEK